MIGGTNSNNGWRTVWEKLSNPSIDSDGGKDTKYHLSFSVLPGQLLRHIQKIRVMKSYLGTLWHKILPRVASTQEESQAKKEGGMTDLNAQIYSSERK